MKSAIQSNISSLTLRNCLVFLGLCFLVSLAVNAQTVSLPTVSIGSDGVSTGGGTVGSSFWSAIKGLWFGPLGLVGGALIFSMAVYFYFKDGMLAVFGVLAVGTAFFFIPGIVTAVQSWARSF